MNRGSAFYFLSCLYGLKECFIPFTPRKTLGWLAILQLIIISGCFGASVFLVALVPDVLPRLSITSIVISVVAMTASILGVVGFALDHPEVYLAYCILSLIITAGNVLALFYFTYVAIDTSMKELYEPTENRWNEKNGEKFNASVGIVAAAFAMELVLFISSAFISIRARANAVVRLENEEIDALLQDAEDELSQQSFNRSYTEQIEAQTRILNTSRSSRRDSFGSLQNSLTQSQQSQNNA